MRLDVNGLLFRVFTFRKWFASGADSIFTLPLNELFPKAALLILLLSAMAAPVSAEILEPFGVSPDMYAGSTPGKSYFAGRFGYLGGINEIRFRDGDNGNILPGKKDIEFKAPAFGLTGATYPTNDLLVRGRAWINIPIETRTDFHFEQVRREWRTLPLMFEADLSAIYFFALYPMPYSGGITAGYRYYEFDYSSKRPGSSSQTFNDHLHIHVPYIGFHYQHRHFLDSLVTMDLGGSPLAFSTVDAQQNLTNGSTRVDGNSITGAWFETVFEWSKRIGKQTLVGAFAKYNYLELSGGATLSQSNASTRFSMDSRHHLIFTGLSLKYSF